jgi:hypothetical protein
MTCSCDAAGYGLADNINVKRETQGTGAARPEGAFEIFSKIELTMGGVETHVSYARLKTVVKKEGLVQRLVTFTGSDRRASVSR